RAADVQISDGASVLDINKIKAMASSLPRSIYIFTTPSFTSSSASTPPGWLQDPTARAQYRDDVQKDTLPSEFDAHTKDSLSTSNTDIAIGIDVKDRYISIQSNSGVPLSNDAASKAVDDFKANVGDNDYTYGLIAAL